MYNFEFRRCSTLPPRRQGSTIDAGGLNLRVRNGYGCDPSAIATGNISRCYVMVYCRPEGLRYVYGNLSLETAPT